MVFFGHRRRDWILVAAWGLSICGSAAAVEVRFSGLLGEEPYFEVAACGYAPSGADAAKACSRKGVAELIAWVNGMRDDCQGPKAEAFVAELADKLAQRAKNRAANHQKLTAMTAAERNEIFPVLVPELSAAEADAALTEFLDALKEYVRTQQGATREDTVLFHSYFHTGAYGLNRVLREGGTASECLAPLVQAMRAAFDRLPRFAGTVWRGLRLPAEVLATYAPGTELAWPAFSSTSLDRKTAEGFAGPSGAVFKIEVKGCADVRGASALLWESEVLCLPDTRVRVTGREAPNVVAFEEIMTR